MSNFKKLSDNVVDYLNIDSLNTKNQQIEQKKQSSDSGDILEKAAIERMNNLNKISLYERLSEYYVKDVDYKNTWIYYLKKISYVLIFIVFIYIFKDMFGDLSKYENN